MTDEEWLDFLKGQHSEIAARVERVMAERDETEAKYCGSSASWVSRFKAMKAALGLESLKPDDDTWPECVVINGIGRLRRDLDAASEALEIATKERDDYQDTLARIGREIGCEHTWGEESRRLVRCLRETRQDDHAAARDEAVDLRKRVEGLMAMVITPHAGGFKILGPFASAGSEWRTDRPSAEAAVWAAMGMTPLEPREGE